MGETVELEVPVYTPTPTLPRQGRGDLIGSPHEGESCWPSHKVCAERYRGREEGHGHAPHERTLI
jgi:hypothetical protein